MNTKPLILTIALFILSLNIITTASAEPADDTYVFVAQSGKVWHAYRDCGEITDKLWYI